MIRRAALLGFGLVVAVIVYATLCPIGDRPRTGQVFMERSAAFAAMGGLWILAQTRRPVLGLAAIALGGLALEAAQTLVPGRDARPVDAVEKLAGLLVGALIAAVVVRAAARTRRGDRPAS